MFESTPFMHIPPIRIARSFTKLIQEINGDSANPIKFNATTTLPIHLYVNVPFSNDTIWLKGSATRY
jgi:hypothetical protein